MYEKKIKKIISLFMVFTIAIGTMCVGVSAKKVTKNTFTYNDKYYKVT